MKIMLTLNFETPLQLNLDPQSNFFFASLLDHFLGKVSTHNNVAPKLNLQGQKFGGGLKSPAPPPGL